jgi:threonine/homoserine/homoserine lactone efflux protein
LVIAVLVGPVFFALIQTSLNKGFLAGVTFALGIFLSDATFFILSYFGISTIAHSQSLKTMMGVGGGAFLIGFGLSLALRKVDVNRIDDADIKANSLIRNTLKGFLMNSINPGVFFYWLSVVGAATVKFDAVPRRIFAFFITTMLIVFSMDVLKSYLAARLKKVITNKLMTWLNRVSGSILVLAGGKLLYDFVPRLFAGLLLTATH